MLWAGSGIQPVEFVVIAMSPSARNLPLKNIENKSQYS
jgi:hypothetical protein